MLRTCTRTTLRLPYPPWQPTKCCSFPWDSTSSTLPVLRFILLYTCLKNLFSADRGRVCSSCAVGIGWAYYKSGLLTYLITNSDLPAWLPFKMNTATFSFILPNLYKLYPSTTPFTHTYSAIHWIR